MKTGQEYTVFRDKFIDHIVSGAYLKMLGYSQSNDIFDIMLRFRYRNSYVPRVMEETVLEMVRLLGIKCPSEPEKRIKALRAHMAGAHDMSLIDLLTGASNGTEIAASNNRPRPTALRNTN